MSALWLAVLAMAAGPYEGGSTPPAATQSGASASAIASVPRTGAELAKAIQEAMRHWSRTPSKRDAIQAGRALLDLYGQLQADTRMSPATRGQLQGKLSRRLAELARQIGAANARQARQTMSAQQAAVGPSAQPPADGGGAVPAAVRVPEARGENLAQWGGAGWGGAGVGPGGMAGAGAPGMAGAPGGAAAADDDGEMLVDLIQKTIAPQSWDINGGPGSIYYWRPGRALVVRQTDQGHEAIGDFLGQMQKLGQ